MARPSHATCVALLLGALYPAPALSTECRYPEAPPKDGHLWSFAFRIENSTRKDARIVIRQGKRVVVDRDAPGDSEEYPAKEGLPFVREVYGRLDDRMNALYLEANFADRTRLSRTFSISGFTKRTDMDFRMQIRGEDLLLRQDHDRFTGETSSEPSDPAFGFPATREEFQRREAERRIYASCGTLYVNNRTDHRMWLRVTANEKTLFDGVLDPWDPLLDGGHQVPKEYFLGSTSMPVRHPSSSRTTFVLDPSICELLVEDTSVHTTWKVPLSAFWSGSRDADYGKVAVNLGTTGAPTFWMGDFR